MRLDLLSVLGALWSGTDGSQVCTVGRDPLANPILEITWSPEPGRVTAFIAVNVVPMDRERVLTNQTVVVEDGRITALGPANQVKVPANAERIDGRGQYLMPGLGDMHRGPFHRVDAPPAGQEQAFADDLFTKYVAYGVTAIRSLQGSDADAVQRLHRIFADFPVPRMYLGQEGVPRKLLWSNPDSVAAAFAMMKAVGYSHFVRDTKADSLLLVAIGQQGFPMVIHSHPLSFPQVLRVGASRGSVEHLYMFWDSLLGKPGSPVVEPKEQRQPVDLPMAKVPALVASLKRAGVWITPSLQCMENTHPYIKGNALARIVKALQDADVKMLLGGDGWGLSAWSVHGELVAMVRAGLTPYQALVTGTRNVAEFFHLLDSTGTVAIGKRADLVLLSGNPLQDIRHTWVPAGVMIAGRWFNRVMLDQRLTASPRRWFKEQLGRYMAIPIFREFLSEIYSPPRTTEQWDELEQRGKRVVALAHSLDPTKHQEYQRILASMAAELGAFRAILAPNQRETFDVNLRVWLREQTRQGRSMTIPGISPTP